MRSVAFAFVCAAVLLGCGEPQLVVPDTLWAEVLPPHGSEQIGPDVEPLVYFTHPVANANAVPESIGLSCRGAPPCSQPDTDACTQPDVEVAVLYDAAAQVATVNPEDSLQADTCYTLVISAGLEAAPDTVGALPTRIRSGFRTR